MRVLRIAVLLLVAFGASVASAQSQAPPDRWHPYNGGRNCIQVVDSNGFFNCAPSVTIDPVSGVFSSVLGGPMGVSYSALVIAPQNSGLQVLGNDLVLAVSSSTIAKAGPGKGALTLRVRRSPTIPGACQIVVIAGGAFGLEYPVAFVDPSRPFTAPFTDLPGGPGGCS